MENKIYNICELCIKSCKESCCSFCTSFVTKPTFKK
nr:MAG TPA: Colipase [Crassvirales sp.]